MKGLCQFFVTILFLGSAFSWSSAIAGEVQIKEARAEKMGENIYQFSVTLLHEDTGWDHYADEWRVVTNDGTVLGTRILHHPHVDEQPFTRSLSGVQVPPGHLSLFIEARDSVHGRSPKRFEVLLPQ